MTTTTVRAATVTDIVRRLTGTPYATTAETAIATGIGIDLCGIIAALDDAIDCGYVQVVRVRDTTYGKGIRFVALADGVAYCRTCIVGCDHPVTRDGDSCRHQGCWGPNATNDCAGAHYARTNVHAYDDIN